MATRDTITRCVLSSVTVQVLRAFLRLVAWNQDYRIAKTPAPRLRPVEQVMKDCEDLVETVTVLGQFHQLQTSVEESDGVDRTGSGSAITNAA